MEIAVEIGRTWRRFLNAKSAKKRERKDREGGGVLSVIGHPF